MLVVVAFSPTFAVLAVGGGICRVLDVEDGGVELNGEGRDGMGGDAL